MQRVLVSFDKIETMEIREMFNRDGKESLGRQQQKVYIYIKNFQPLTAEQIREAFNYVDNAGVYAIISAINGKLTTEQISNNCPSGEFKKGEYHIASIA